MRTLQFWRGPRLYHVTEAREGPGFIGLCDGSIVAQAPEASSVMRTLIMTDHWRRRGREDEVAAAVTARMDQERRPALGGMGAGS